MLPSDIEIKTVHLHDFVREILEKYDEGCVIKSYEQSKYMPQHNSVMYYCVMSIPFVKEIEEAVTLADSGEFTSEEKIEQIVEKFDVERKKPPVPPIRRKAQ